MAPDNTQTERSEELGPRIAVKDGFAIERISGVEVRRQVIAGQPVPAHYEVDEDLLGDKKENTLLRARGYKPGQIEERVSYSNEGGVEGVETDTVERRFEDAGRPEAVGEKELADEHTPLASDPSEEERGSSSRKRAAAADKEQAKSRAGDREGTPAERIEKRLKADKPEEESKGADKAPAARGGRKPDGAQPPAEAKGD